MVPLVSATAQSCRPDVFTMKEYVNAAAALELNRDLAEKLIKLNCDPQSAYTSRKDLFALLDAIYSRHYVCMDISPVILSMDVTSGKLWHLKSDVIALEDYAEFFR